MVEEVAVEGVIGIAITAETGTTGETEMGATEIMEEIGIMAETGIPGGIGTEIDETEIVTEIDGTEIVT